MPPRPLVAGNWKMNGLASGLSEIRALIDGLRGGVAGTAEVVVCPPATLLSRMAETVADMAAETALALGGQDCHANSSGAHTGDISAEMLADAGAAYVIVGHSERRTDHGESDSVVRDKTLAAWRAGLTAILCVGETQAERDAGKTLEVLAGQIAGSVPEGATAQNLVIAYEPVWAIGTGLTPTTDDVFSAHELIRSRLAGRVADAGAVRILYGGSVKPGNAAELMGLGHVDGALVGGASLKAADFLAIASVYGKG